MTRGASVVGRWMLPAGSDKRGTLFPDDIAHHRSVLVVLGHKLYRLDAEGRLYLLSTFESDIRAIARENWRNLWIAMENGTCAKDSIKSRPEQVSIRLVTSGSGSPPQSNRVSSIFWSHRDERLFLYGCVRYQVVKSDGTCVGSDDDAHTQDVCRTLAVRTSCSLLTVEFAALLFENEDEVDLIGDLEGRVWARDKRGRRKLEALDLGEPVRQIVVGRGVAVVGSLGTAKLVGSNGVVLCRVPQPSSLSCALEPPSGGFAVSIVSNRSLFIVSDEGKVARVNTRRSVDSALQTSEGVYLLYRSGHLEKIGSQRFFAPISNPSKTKDWAFYRIGAILGAIEKLTEKTYELESENGKLVSSLSSMNSALQLLYSRSHCPVKLRVQTSCLTNCLEPDPNVVVHLALENRSNIRVGGIGWSLAICIATGQESKSCNYLLTTTELEGSGPAHIGDLPIRLDVAETSVISSQLVFTVTGGAESRRYEPVVIMLDEELLDAPFLFRGTNIGENRQNLGIQSRAVVHFRAGLSTNLRTFVQEAMKPLVSTQTAEDHQELEFFGLDGKLLLLDLRYSVSASRRQCEATARGELSMVAALRASIIRRMMASPRVKASFRDQTNGNSWVHTSSVQQSIADLWAIAKESASGMTAAIKDEAETAAAVKTKLVGAYTEARNRQDCVFEVLNNCADSG
eukprot:CAMPEP_0184741110 /NCGR_PEP_ID=MMETSP0315-20130426/4191_1 /TAXON_ID=101924 /ORGANISM="Rhodosorus marinus, Strain UTEX LB 2760" /LENGTH=683 /DNA_ID=CAMNT_0027211257 /DNA_START=607 /DNA_END=2658 /DNA_ORIENTATION=-